MYLGRRDRANRFAPTTNQLINTRILGTRRGYTQGYTEERPRPISSRRFKPLKLNAARFDQSWDRKRGAAVRLTAVLLQEDDTTLQGRVCENDKVTACIWICTLIWTNTSDSRRCPK